MTSGCWLCGMSVVCDAGSESDWMMVLGGFKDIVRFVVSVAFVTVWLREEEEEIRGRSAA